MCLGDWAGGVMVSVMKEHIKDWGAIGQMAIIAFVIAIGLWAIKYVYCCPESMDLITTIATTVIAATAVIAAFYSYWQYKNEREKKIENDTIELMSRYETDPVLYKSRKYLNRIRREENGDLSKVENTGELKFHSSTLLNYYEGLAYRYYKGTVDKETIKKQYKDLIVPDFKVFIENEPSEKSKPTKEPMFDREIANTHLPYLVRLYDEISSSQSNPTNKTG